MYLCDLGTQRQTVNKKPSPLRYPYYIPDTSLKVPVRFIKLIIFEHGNKSSLIFYCREDIMFSSLSSGPQRKCSQSENIYIVVSELRGFPYIYGGYLSTSINLQKFRVTETCPFIYQMVWW